MQRVVNRGINTSMQGFVAENIVAGVQDYAS